ncbi:hypothetical protein COZ41_00750 [Candidatus Shapirobacteria bacterium CG_4_10_14_3_um_filter_35_13]|uniref:Uncharacterized protein n=1 Tax=Candidatus Shapirobacteria bacterium CG_4_10_14_3_um_filter_35_13 TaxID=1974873 RepID=A0A2M7LJK1_9BACT|nr:MAG: hypothetical protein COZ41_00750 [Candidatus Shapirobacteria bacterium CG_4_10_14_3_um_filter_35_13]
MSNYTKFSLISQVLNYNIKSLKIFEIGKVNFSVAWYDLWIGFFVDSNKRKVYFCPLPCLLFTITI